MRFTNALLLALNAGFSVAGPIAKRVATPAVNDGIILNYALTLEYLERKFYQEGLANYTQADFVAAGFPDPFYGNLQEIYQEEQTHVAFLTTALEAAGIQPVEELTYKFGVSDVTSFVTLSSVLEGVGVSAYLGAAASIASKAYLTAAAAILTVEARHVAYVRASIGESPFPNSFDTPLDFNEVYSLASAFITSVPANNTVLPFKAFPTLTLQCSQYYYQANSSSVTFTNAFTNAQKFSNGAITASTPIYAVFFSGLMVTPVQVRITQTQQDYKIDTIPAMNFGQVYIVLSTAANATDETIIAGPALLEVSTEFWRLLLGVEADR
ncbi:MAG: hypothetical protein M1827_003740 [Pycnora praestabilis]|nr:MAG: hypothetical protein M1827_003740 [Pycnora praestabilis]